MGYEILPDSALSDSSQANYLRLRHLQVTQLLTRFEHMLIPGNGGMSGQIKSDSFMQFSIFRNIQI